MPAVYDLIKDRTETYQVQADQSVINAVRLMVEKNIGALPVVRNGELVGIFSERDLMKRVVAVDRDVHKTSVADVMTTSPMVVSPEEDLGSCLGIMRQRGFRHLPICEGRQLKGLISLRDILLREVVEKDGEVQMMRAYISQQS